MTHLVRCSMRAFNTFFPCVLGSAHLQDVLMKYSSGQWKNGTVKAVCMSAGIALGGVAGVCLNPRLRPSSGWKGRLFLITIPLQPTLNLTASDLPVYMVDGWLLSFGLMAGGELGDALLRAASGARERFNALFALPIPEQTV